jgi:hypothetical protein
VKVTLYFGRAGKPRIEWIVRVESAMKALVGVIAALVIVGIAALGLFRAQQLSVPTDHAARPAFRDRAPRRINRPRP